MANELRFGTGGVPLTTPKGGLVNGIPYLHQLGLQHMELEFVQSVYVKPEKAPEIKALAQANDVSLSVHGSYYVNLASNEKDKWHASINRVVQAAEVGDMCGAVSITYHSGFFQKQSEEEVFQSIVTGMGEIFKELNKKDVNIKIAPELTGKASQYGDLPGLIRLVQALREQGYKQASLCIDFAHNYARHGGRYNSYDEFMGMLDEIHAGLGREYLDGLHIHISAIEYSDKGEKNHLLLMKDLDEYRDAGIVVPGIEEHWKELGPNRFLENKFDWRDLLKALKNGGVGGYVVCESPLLELDALLMQQVYRSL